MTPVFGFNDITCSKCGKNIGWYGEIEKPCPCDTCGHDMTEECKGLEAKLKKARDEALAEVRKGKGS